MREREEKREEKRREERVSREKEAKEQRSKGALTAARFFFDQSRSRFFSPSLSPSPSTLIYSPALAAAATGSVVVTDARVASAALLLLRGAAEAEDSDNGDAATDERSAAAARRAVSFCFSLFIGELFFRGSDFDASEAHSGCCCLWGRRAAGDRRRGKRPQAISNHSCFSIGSASSSSNRPRKDSAGELALLSLRSHSLTGRGEAGDARAGGRAGDGGHCGFLGIGWGGGRGEDEKEEREEKRAKEEEKK